MIKHIARDEQNLQGHYKKAHKRNKARDIGSESISVV